MEENMQIKTSPQTTGIIEDDVQSVHMYISQTRDITVYDKRKNKTMILFQRIFLI